MGDILDVKKSPVLNFIKSVFTGGKQSQPQAYTGTQPSYLGGRSGGAKWPYGLSASGASTNYDHYELRQNARALMQDSPQGRALVERKVDSIVYTGLKLESTPDAAILGITQEEASAKGRDISARFHLFASDKKQHRAENLTLYQAQRLWALFAERENDIFVRLYYSPDRKLQNPLQFEFLDPNQIRGNAYTTSYGFQCQHDGIIRDDRGRETGYKIWVRNQQGQYEEITINARGPKSERIFMLHGFRQEYAGQGRGYTKLAPIIQELENYTDWTASHIKKAINQATIVGWIKPSKDEDAQPILDNLTAAGVGVADELANTTGTDTVTDIPLDGFQCYDIPEATFGAPGGAFVQSLTKGADITLAPQNAPLPSYDKFQAAFLESITSVTGYPKEMVHMKFGSNYAANRATLLLAYQVIEIERQEMASDFLNPLYEMWMAGEVAAGRISLPGWSDPRLRAAWLKCIWRGTGVPDIDPAKLATAREKNLTLGATNIEREAQNHNGTSAEDNIATNNRIYQSYQGMPWVNNVAQQETSEEEDDE